MERTTVIFRCQTICANRCWCLKSVHSMRCPVLFRHFYHVLPDLQSWSRARLCDQLEDRATGPNVAATWWYNNPWFPSNVQRSDEEATSVKTTNWKTVRTSWRSQQSACNATIFDVASRPLERRAGSIVAKWVARKSICSNAAGHDIVVGKKVQDVLTLQTSVQAGPGLVATIGSLGKRREFSSRQRQITECQTSAFVVPLDALVRAPLPATCIRWRASRPWLDKCWRQRTEPGTEWRFEGWGFDTLSETLSETDG